MKEVVSHFLLHLLPPYLPPVRSRSLSPRLPSVRTPYRLGSLPFTLLTASAPLYCFDLMLCKKTEFKLKKLVREYNC